MDDVKNREKWIDVLRVTAACAVIMLHTITGVMDHIDMSGYGMEYTVFVIVLDLVTWSVPVFIMISGYLFLDPGKKISFGTMVQKYCRRVVLALLLFGIPYACLEMIAEAKSFRLRMVWKAFLMVLRGESWSHMWYLYLILFLYLFTPLFKKCLEFIPRWGLWLVLAGLFWASAVLPFIIRFNGNGTVTRIQDDLVYVLYYLLGYVFVTHKSNSGILKKEPSSNHSVKRIILLSVLTGFVAALLVGSRLTEGYEVRMAYNYPPTVLLAVLILGIVKTLEPVWQRTGGKRLAVLSSYSFAIYLIHPVFLNLFYKFLHLTPLSYPLYWSLPLFYGLTFLLSVAGAGILHHILWLKKSVL